jgi:hypothetical protein
VPQNGSHLIVKLSLRETLKEIAALIAKDLWLNNKHAINGSLYYIHIIDF